MDPLRRKLLVRGAAIAAGTLLPWPGQGQSSLLSLPKVALVFGNSGYRVAPLKNPANDARAIAEALKSVGFAVTLKLDAGQADMAGAVRAYTQELAKRKCVGLFYYAGHGLQLAWRNYMLPVDAVIDTVADIQKQGVEVNALLEGLTRAANAMNVIILDACRDNPFGQLKGIDHKGLSQMDAPPSTIVAYATSPGNVASDGEGTNGLYTENLLKEIKVPEAKLEDVFKRVRLAVRRRSNGAQIPWESTSLEADFYFIPPRELKGRSELELDREFEEELGRWNRIKEAIETSPFEEYLQQYPSGRYAEIALLRLDQILAKQGEKKIEIAFDAANPFSKGTARADTRFEVGERFVYRILDLHTGKEVDRARQTVARITDTEVIYNDGGFVTDLLGNELKSSRGRENTQPQFYPLEYAVGKKWTTRFLTVGQKGGEQQAELDFRVIGRETVTVPAGTFDAFRVEGSGWYGARLQQKFVYWMAPAKVKRYVAREHLAYGGRKGGKIRSAERRELMAYIPAPR